LILDLLGDCKVVSALGPSTLTATSQGAYGGADFSNTEPALGMIVNAGAFGGGSTSIQVQAEESVSTAGPWTVVNQVGGGTMVFTATGAGQAVLIGITQYRYIRANAVTLVGQTSSFPVNVTLIAGLKVAGLGSGSTNYPVGVY
jgi:hypothetical protein